MIESGLQPELLLSKQVRPSNSRLGLRRRRHIQGWTSPVAANGSGMRPRIIRLRRRAFVGVVVSLKDLSASIWLWQRD